ncbi:DEAD/DEAH box helicase [Emcibacter nanhaiensis]|uniref:DEAD/DEAH box helicase n=1 Tax=Emcibacter nanhaiensis TaxID=1505037 RepID=A0A501PG63_9PROT|nr:DEAD/DEAH box helicase [Emcibacter nanhaiensis]TPD58954.1 DEAD/DEAH box helicase [Emcibacter nanhaiensis]
MAFKKAKKDISVPASPEELFLELSARKYSNVLLHQGEMLREYARMGIDPTDVALELPTGSGKTLVGLLIAEWRRRKFKEKTVFLCPTKQLVNQVVEEAKNNYGLNVIGYTGSARNYTPEQRSNYTFNNSVSVTTYSSLFNSNPFFRGADLLILDDAHACENYIGKYWSLSIERLNEKHKRLHELVSNLINPFLRPVDQDRLVGKFPKPADASWVDKIPSRNFNEIRDMLYSLLETHAESAELNYSWQALRNNFHSCHIFISSSEILLRPTLFPTWEHDAFSSPKQRLYMSATFSKGGDLERITGRSNILKIPAPDSFKLHGIGRRFFTFPDLTLDESKCDDLVEKLMLKGGRSLYLVPSLQQREKVVSKISKIPSIKIYDAKSLEESKKSFIDENLAAAVLANRYDGIDFRGEACRLLFVEGLPRAMNLNERFLMDKMAASIIFNERVQTRVVQAVGRCTRSLEDYSAVVILGKDIPDYLINEKNTQYLHPNLQAELKFGKEQSNEMSLDDFLENMGIFLEHDEDWFEVEEEIISYRNDAEANDFPSIDILQESVRSEIQYQKHFWNSDYEKAVEAAELILGIINGPSGLRGYRAWWHYLAGSACDLASELNPSYRDRAEEHYKKARDAAPTLQWLIPLSRKQASSESNASTSDIFQLTNIENLIDHMGPKNHIKFDAHIKSIVDNILSNEYSVFETGLKQLGELLGFDAYNEETDGAPDGWWISDDQCIVFEAHSDGDSDTTLGSKKARQVSSHPDWLRENKKIRDDVSVISVLITPCTKINEQAHGLLGESYYYNLEKFRTWACGAVRAIKEVRASFNNPGDLVWQAEALEILGRRDVLVSEIVADISSRPSKIELEKV